MVDDGIIQSNNVVDVSIGVSKEDEEDSLMPIEINLDEIPDRANGSKLFVQAIAIRNRCLAKIKPGCGGIAKRVANRKVGVSFSPNQLFSLFKDSRDKIIDDVKSFIGPVLSIPRL